MVIDSHCHFNHERLAGDIPETIARAGAAGVTAMIVVGFDLPSSIRAVELAEQYPGTLYAVVGIHPHDSRYWDDEAAEQIVQLASKPGVVAIGEIGLDFHHNFSPREDQYRAFRAQLEIARKADIPIVIHCREAYPETLGVLGESGRPVSGVMHCWAGTLEEAWQTVDIGLHLGFGGTLTFKNAEEIRAAAAAIPADRILVETDAPYLAPMPHRGKRNEPAYTALVVQKLAEIRGISYADAANLTTTNARRLFARMDVAAKAHG